LQLLNQSVNIYTVKLHSYVLWICSIGVEG
jgi:hypothetical protein